MVEIPKGIGPKSKYIHEGEETTGACLGSIWQDPEWEDPFYFFYDYTLFDLEFSKRYLELLKELTGIDFDILEDRIAIRGTKTEKKILCTMVRYLWEAPHPRIAHYMINDSEPDLGIRMCKAHLSGLPHWYQGHCIFVSKDSVPTLTTEEFQGRIKQQLNTVHTTFKK